MVKVQTVNGGEWFIASNPVMVNQGLKGLFIQYQPAVMKLLKSGVHYKKETVYVGPFQSMRTEPKYDSYANLYCYTTFDKYYHAMETGVVSVEELGELVPIRVEIVFP